MRQTQVILSGPGALCAVCGWPINDPNYHYAPQSPGSAAVIYDSNIFRFLCRQS